MFKQLELYEMCSWILRQRGCLFSLQHRMFLMHSCQPMQKMLPSVLAHCNLYLHLMRLSLARLLTLFFLICMFGVRIRLLSIRECLCPMSGFFSRLPILQYIFGLPDMPKWLLSEFYLKHMRTLWLKYDWVRILSQLGHMRHLSERLLSNFRPVPTLLNA